MADWNSVHYDDFNKRLDEWITADRIDLDQEVEWPAPEKPDKKKSGANDKSKSQPAGLKNKKQKSKLDREISAAPEQISVNVPGKAPRPPEAGGKENQETLTVTELVPETPQADEDMADVVDLADAAAMAKAVPAEPISREDEIEKLRTSGSMTQNQAGIRNNFH
jgi:histone acetyltransferase HTATIP